MQADERANMQDTIDDLAANPKELSELYNDFACPLQQWGLALEMVGLAKYNDPVYVRQLWDVYLRQVLIQPAPEESLLNVYVQERTDAAVQDLN